MGINLNDLPEAMRKQAAQKLNEQAGDGLEERAEQLLGRERKKPTYPEQSLQTACMTTAREWPLATLLRPPWPRAICKAMVGDYLYHIPNQRSLKVQRQILYSMGVKSGVFDLFLMIPTTEAPGLYLETKAGSNGLSDNQKAFKVLAQGMGFTCGEYRTQAEFQAHIEQYLIGSQPNPYYIDHLERESNV